MDATTVTNVTAGAETFTCNAYLVEGDRTVLVDAGAYEGVVDAIAEHTDTLDAVVLTHQHTDHVGGLDAVLDAFDAPLYAYAEHPRRETALEAGDQVFIGEEPFDVVYTPGHADDHVSFVSETTLFSGDVVVHNDGAFEYGSFGRTDMAGQSRERLIESLRTLLTEMGEGIEHMYAGHGEEFHGDVRDVVETALGRAEKREPKYPDS
ncbi:MBL fold metallo-hydrolase [Natronomonas sp. F2-12]|jgi:glyoxylase-like metal-dependent hydrolase (beta-lactamase superfamily II)|uniref:MBL fold metallo-hydrolase n=1 Tax=Natronomonas aquatica TaxID=2841590 RepID=A0A9R1CV04_9EURY|nr:MBL fold metallo-hydrolase [Natronomonas aquatica]MCQ4334575.1 MBL fold metallo-hydrolase [Natronomonas aquatica]